MRAEEYERLLSRLEKLDEELREVGVGPIEKFSTRYSQLRKMVEDAGTKRLPHRAAVRQASKSLAADIHEDYEQGLLGDSEMELLDPVFAKLKYGDAEAAGEALDGARDRARLLARHGEALERYAKAYRGLRGRVEKLRSELEEVEEELSIAREHVGEAEELREYRDSVEVYNDAVAEALKDFVNRDCSEVLGLVLHARYFPETNPPNPRSPRSAEELASKEGYTVFDLLELEGYSEEKLRHVLDDGERVKSLVDSNVVWLREVSRLHETDFLRMSIEPPSTALHRARFVKRELERIGGPVEELRRVEAAARQTGSSTVRLNELATETGLDPAELEEKLEERAGDAQDELEEAERLLRGLRPPGDFRVS
ncbi:MAG: hypothetical protein MAG715_00538 [Methanonatronarchaeales archaeon]|nr:hypothetical protein [Methanonatronarchaeales archaeon]